MAKKEEKVEKEKKETKTKKVKKESTEKKEKTVPKTKKIEKEPKIEPKKESKTKKETKKKREEKTEKVEETKKSKKEKKEDALVVKKNSKELVIDEEKLEKIAEERKKQVSLPIEEKNKINKELFINIILAIAIVLFFFFINMGYINIKESTYTTDLQVFSIAAIAITIFIFEKAYKKDDDKIALLGIEMLALSICTLLTNYIYKYHNNVFVYIINVISMLFGIYYVGKSIIVYKKMRKEALKNLSDVRKIIKK